MSPTFPAVSSIDKNLTATSGTKEGSPSMATVRVVNLPKDFALTVDSVEACIPDGGVNRGAGTVTFEVPDHRFFFPVGPCVIDPAQDLRVPADVRATPSRPGVVQIAVIDLKSGTQSVPIPFFYNPPIGPTEPAELEDRQGRLIDRRGLQVPLECQYFTFLDEVSQNGYPDPTLEGTKVFLQRVDGDTVISQSLPITDVQSDDRVTLEATRARLDPLLASPVTASTRFRIRIETPNGPPVQVPVFLALPFPIERPGCIVENGSVVVRWINNCDGPPLLLADDVPFEEIDPDLVGTAGNSTPFNKRFPADERAGVEDYVNGFRILRQRLGSSDQAVVERNFDSEGVRPPGQAEEIIQEYREQLPSAAGIYSYTIVGQIAANVPTAPVEVYVPVQEPGVVYDLIWERVPRLELCNNETDDDGDGLIDAKDPDCNEKSEAGRLAELLQKLGRRVLIFNRPAGLSKLLESMAGAQRARIASLWILHGETTMTEDPVTQRPTLSSFRGAIPFFDAKDVDFLLANLPRRVWISAGNLWSRAFDPSFEAKSGPTRRLLQRLLGLDSPPDIDDLLSEITATTGPVTTPPLEGNFILVHLLSEEERRCATLAGLPFETVALRDDLFAFLSDENQGIYFATREVCIDELDNDDDGLIDLDDPKECPRETVVSIFRQDDSLRALSSSFTAFSFGDDVAGEVVDEVRCFLGLENCTNRVDDNDDGAVDLLDATCFQAFEVCGNRRDDDADRLVDCDDPDCAGVHQEGEQFENCFNEIDDDCDGKIDLQDPGCDFDF